MNKTLEKVVGEISKNALKHILIPGYSSYRFNEIVVKLPKPDKSDYDFLKFATMFITCSMFDFYKGYAYLKLISEVIK